MTSFTVRVELHGATSADYDVLHVRMGAAGFARTVTGVDTSGASARWMLPTGEYDYSSETENAFAVRDKVKIIAESVKIGSWVLVTKVAERAWNTRKLQS